MKLNHIILLGTLIFLFSYCGQKALMINQQKLSHIEIYLYNIYPPDTKFVKFGDIVRDGKLNPSINKRWKLSSKQARQIIKIIEEPRPKLKTSVKRDPTKPPPLPPPPPPPPLDCFNPRHGIIYYGTNGEIIESISICFECGRYKVNPHRIPKNKYMMIDIQPVLTNFDIPIYYENNEYYEYLQSN